MATHQGIERKTEVQEVVMTDLPSLITRLREADGPSRELDADIMAAVTNGKAAEYQAEFPGWYWDGYRCHCCAEKITASLDAAVALAERLVCPDYELERYNGKSYAWLPGQSYTSEGANLATALLIAVLTAWGERQNG